MCRSQGLRCRNSSLKRSCRDSGSVSGNNNNNNNNTTCPKGQSRAPHWAHYVSSRRLESTRAGQGRQPLSLALVNTMLFYTQTRTHTQTQCCIKVVWQATGDGDTMLTKSLLNPQTVRRTVPACTPPSLPFRLPLDSCLFVVLMRCCQAVMIGPRWTWTRVGHEQGLEKCDATRMRWWRRQAPKNTSNFKYFMVNVSGEAGVRGVAIPRDTKI